MKVLISDNIDEESCLGIFNREGIQTDFQPQITPELLLDAIGEYDGLLVRSRTQVTTEVLEKAVKLKVIGRAGSGVDNIDVKAATRHGVIVMNAPGGNTIAAAEHAISMMMALSRNIPQASLSLKSGNWEKKKFVGHELYQKTLGVIGLGKIGRAVASRAHAFEMKILGYDPLVSQEVAASLKISLVSLEEIYQKSDIITIHTPLIPETRHLIGKDAFSQCRDGVLIINCARGGIIDENALAEAIENGKVGGAALDVFENEPPLEDNPLFKLQQTIVTPHLGASTEEAQKRVARQIAEQLADALLNRNISHAINAVTLDSELAPILGPYIELSEKLGSLQAQMCRGNIRKISIQYFGDITQYPLRVLTVALLKGLLNALVSFPVNEVNAVQHAEERGIEFDETMRSSHEDYLNLIRVELHTDREQRVISGTIFGKQNARIVQLDKFKFDAEPKGDLLITTSVDKPGMIGKIGTILANHNVNIANMYLGRDETGGNAMTMMNLDSEVSYEAIEEFRKTSGFNTICKVKL